MTRRITVTDIQQLKERGERISMLTAYDFPSARIADEAGIHILLVGDSVGMVVLGYESTLPVTVDDMIHHGRPVVRASKRAHVVIDLPFGSYQRGWQQAMESAVRIMQETGAGAVKLEGGMRSADTVDKLVQAGIPVMGHVGLTPQSVNTLGGFKIQGKTPRDSVRVLQDAKALEDAGAYAVVLESVPAAVAASITDKLTIPTIGIGAGPYCSGQVQVWQDLLGIDEHFKPRHAKHYLKGATLIRDAVARYREEVESGAFPSAAESFYLDERAMRRIEYLRSRHQVEPQNEAADTALVMYEAEHEQGSGEGS